MLTSLSYQHCLLFSLKSFHSTRFFHNLFVSTLRIYFSFFLRFPLKCDLSGVCECVFVSKYGYIQTEREREREKESERDRECEKVCYAWTERIFTVVVLYTYYSVAVIYVYCSSIRYLLQCSSYICLL